MVCAQCGASGATDARFCSQCGQRVGPPASDLTGSGERPRAQLAGERRQVTVLFCDLVNSTELATRIDPEEMRDVMRAYQDTCAHAIAAFEGRIAQTLGDGLLVYFGYPEAHEDDAQRAVRAALAIVSAVSNVDGELHRLWPQCAVRLGIYTGLVIAGEVGPWDTRLDMAVTGDAPNIAARLQALAGAGQVVIGPTTRQLVEGRFVLRELGPHVIKGVSEPMRIWRVLGGADSSGRAAPRLAAAGTPFVGRSAELDVLRAAFARACAGEGQALLISGPAGIGKSRLVQAFRSELRGQRVICMQYHCSPYFQHTALYPVVAYLQHAAGIRHEHSASLKLRKLRRLLGPLSENFARDLALLARLLQIPGASLPEHAAQTPERLLDDTVEVMLRRSLRLASDAPLLLVLEDAHWIDRTTLRMARALLGLLRGVKVLGIATHRGRFEGEASDAAPLTTLLLDRLDPDASQSIVQHLARHDLPPQLQREIVARGDGIPLFVEELTKAVLETRDGDRLPAVPASLRDSLVARLDRLGPFKRVAQLGACIGRTFAYPLLRLVANMDERQLQAGLGRLLDAELLTRSGELPDASFSFKHALVQSASYESLLRSECRQTHAAIARNLAIYYPQSCENEPEIVAHHLTAASEHAAAVKYWFAAGQLAQQRSAHYEAIQHLEAGLRSLRALPPTDATISGEIDLLGALTRSHMAQGGWNAAPVLAVTERARALARGIGDPVKQSEAIFGSWTYHCVRGEFTPCLRLVEELVPLAEAEHDRRLILMADTIALATYFCLGRFEQAQRHADRVHELYRPEQDRALVQQLNHDPEVFACTYEGLWRWVQGFPDAAARANARAIELARAMPHPFQLCFALCNASAAFVLRGEDARVCSQIDECVTLAREHRIPTFRVYAPLLGAPALMARDPSQATLARLQRCIAAAEASVAGMHMPFYLGHVAQAHQRLGQAREAERCITHALQMIEATGERWMEPELQRLRVRVLPSQPAQAEASLRSALMRARELGARGFELRIACDLAEQLESRSRAGMLEAIALLAPVLSSFEEGRDTRDLQHASALLERLAGKS